MPRVTKRYVNLPVAAAAVLGALGLSACASTTYVDEQIAAANSRIGTVDAKATDALARADAANAAAGAAASDARSAHQRIDQLTARVDSMEQRRLRRPRN